MRSTRAHTHGKNWACVCVGRREYLFFIRVRAGVFVCVFVRMRVCVCVHTMCMLFGCYVHAVTVRGALRWGSTGFHLNTEKDTVDAPHVGVGASA